MLIFINSIKADKVMKMNRKVDENITRRGYNWLENYLMQMIEASYEEIKKGEMTLLDICKGAVDTAKHNHVHYNTREDRMQIYQMAKECLTRVEDYMASQEGMLDNNMFPPHTDNDNTYESKNMENTVRITESQLKQMITESVRRVLNEIGDTNAGLAAIKAAATKASSMGRDTQSQRFEDYGNKLDGGIIQRLNDNVIRFTNANNQTVSIFNNGQVTANGSYGGTLDYASKCFKVSNPRVARIIAKWVSEHVADVKSEATDWHYYYAQ